MRVREKAMHNKFNIALVGIGLLIASNGMAAMVDRSPTFVSSQPLGVENPDTLIAHWYGDRWEPRWRHEPRWDRDHHHYWHEHYPRYRWDDRHSPRNHSHSKWKYDPTPYRSRGKDRPGPRW